MNSAEKGADCKNSHFPVYYRFLRLLSRKRSFLLLYGFPVHLFNSLDLLLYFFCAPCRL